MTKTDYAIEWSEEQRQFHIEEVETIGISFSDWKRIKVIHGTYHDASKWADKWAKENGKKVRGMTP